MPKTKKKSVSKVKVKIKSKVATAKSKNKSIEKNKADKGLVIDLEASVSDQMINHWKKADEENVLNMYGNETYTLGVSDIIQTGLPTLEKNIAIKDDKKSYGMPLGKMIEIYGPESSAKTTFMLYLSCMIIKKGGIAFFVDFENKFDPAWLKTMAIYNGLDEKDLERFLYIRPEHFEWFLVWMMKAMRVISESKKAAGKALIELKNKKGKYADKDEQLIKKYEKDINMPYGMFVDSIASIYTQKEVEEKEETTINVALLARRFAENLKLVRTMIKEAKTLIIWANQERHKIAMGGQKVRPGMMVTPGGTAVKHYCDARMRTSHYKALKRTRDGIEKIYGSIYRFKTTKNQMGIPPFQETLLRMYYDRGFYSFHSILEACADDGLIKKTGSRYTIDLKKYGIIDFEETAIDEIEKEYSNYNLPNILLKLYNRKIESRAKS